MVRNDSCLYWTRNFMRSSSVAYILAVGLCIPQDGITQVLQNSLRENRTILPENLESPDRLQETFDCLREIVEEAENPVKEGKRILEALLGEINLRHGVSLTISQICQWTKENIHMLNLDSNAQSVLLDTIQLLEMEDLSQHSASCHCQSFHSLSNLFHKKKRKHTITDSSSMVRKDEGHGGLIMGGVELLVGVGIGLAIGWTGPGAIVAGMLISDAFTRIVNDGIETGRREKEDREGRPNEDIGKGGIGIGVGTKF